MAPTIEKGLGRLRAAKPTKSAVNAAVRKAPGAVQKTPRLKITHKSAPLSSYQAPTQRLKITFKNDPRRSAQNPSGRVGKKLRVADLFHAVRLACLAELRPGKGPYERLREMNGKGVGVVREGEWEAAVERWVVCGMMRV